MVWKVQWAADQEREVSSLPELDVLLDALHVKFCAISPILVTIEAVKTGDSLTVGLGGDMSVLNYVPGSGNPPYMSSVGNSDAGGLIAFASMGELTEIPTRNAISTSLARRGVRYFAQTGKLCDEISWEED